MISRTDRMELDRQDILKLQEEHAWMRKINKENPQLFDWLIGWHSSKLASLIEKFRKRYHCDPFSKETDIYAYSCLNCPQRFYDSVSAEAMLNRILILYWRRSNERYLQGKGIQSGCP